MGFSETLKSQVKKRAHFRCCLCHAIGVEAHHIIPESEGGADTADNAAPLCPSCHETYGANPQKRKFLREARDFWYEMCERSHRLDSDQLKEISTRIGETASKEDIQQAVKRIEAFLSQSQSGNMGKAPGETTSIELPDTYWVLILASLEPVIRVGIDALRKAKKEGLKLEDMEQLPPEQTAVWVGPLITRAMIVNVLAQKGVMTSEANERFGTKYLHKTFGIALG